MAEVEEKTVFDYERAKFKLGEYKLPIEDRVNEIVEACKKEYPNIDLYLLFIATVDYILTEELKIERTDSNEGKEMYEGYLKQRKIFQYDAVKICDSDGKVLPIEVDENQAKN